MDPKKQTDSLLEWNRLNKFNAEQGFASALFQSMAQTSPIIDKFSMWLLAGTGATGALIISQIEKVIPHLTAVGIKWCLVLLIVSAIFGFFAKYKSLRCQIQTEMDNYIRELMVPIFAKHNEDESRIQEFARQRGLELETEINFMNVIEEVSSPFPFWVKWIIQRNVAKNKGNRQASYHIAVKAYIKQISYAFWQAFFFLAFIGAGAWFARGLA